MRIYLWWSLPILVSVLVDPGMPTSALYTNTCKIQEKNKDTNVLASDTIVP